MGGRRRTLYLGGVTCAVNTTRVSSLTLPSVELEGALALIDSGLAQCVLQRA